MTHDPEDVSHIAGNASDDLKGHVLAMQRLFMGDGTAFGDSIGRRVKVAEVSVRKKADEPEKLEGRVVCEIIVTKDMVNGGGNIHGACSAYLVDLCSLLPLCALSLATSGSGSGGVSQAINMLYHSPARIGDHLRMISTTLTIGTRISSSRCEIWNVNHHRLVASGVQVKMEPSISKL
ncbi:hypothetical protein BD410DRAFT_793126 [Rickenella mellea]|uniref:Thioesterase domain-containing protein n=1 Tax=Rickenella mellea TaxID=50990 RepID=A0A4Y7PVM9_9AGAM|nr:hypothetical protein BD410DRAFT_793126 [Rickenella mellea]